MAEATSHLDELIDGGPEELERKVRRILSGETVLREQLGLSDGQMEALYGVAYGLYQTGRHQDALRVFSMLTSMDPYQYRFVLGTASCFQLLEEPMLAALTFQLAGSLAPAEPAPMLHTAECLLKLRDKDGARAALDETIKRAGDQPQHQPMRRRAEVMRDQLDA